MLRWLLYLCLIFQLIRILMYVYHFDYFGSMNSLAFLKILIGGLRFDWTIIILSNSLMLLTLLFISFLNKSITKIIIHTSFIITHIFLFFNFIDIPYFSYIHKRSTADIFFQLGGQTDIVKQIPTYIKHYWFLIVLFISLLVFNYKVYWKLFSSLLNENNFSFEQKRTKYYIAFTVLIISLSFISIRGGIQRIPIDLVDAGFYAEPQYTPLVINTPFSIIKSFEKQKLIKHSFFNDKLNAQKLKLVKKYPHNKMQHKNIIIIIMESFSKEYTKLGGKKSYTPFLDSLMNISMVFENAWSNGTKSIEGIPAILSSIPSWMDSPYINSLYCNNNTHSLPSLLSKEKYFSAFFHGGINGTMNFDAYATQAGFHRYYGKNEYANDKDFDGHWGIWDEPFLQYCATETSKFSQPFLAAIFTLSSHHPFHIPEKYKNILPTGDLPIHQCIAYADLALSKFFQKIKTTSWYNNTIFVITADHTGISSDTYYSSIAGRYQIPVLIFDPQKNHNVVCKNIIQQIDILPTLLYILNYPYSFFSFGNNYFDSTIAHISVFYEGGYYYLANDSNLVSFRNFNIEKIWDYRNHKLKEINVNSTTKYKIETQIKSIIQAYNNTLIDNSIQ